ncbi:EVE domain-containing protein [Rickettsiales endosymbiont of Stachyamoeba lipophora]|uniref:EVE domain-containing protein n=1 Tax=Rickettsiales endosymbiont of Stachyamoeba lipophora TaxID=2486578 RepID=UPI0019D0A066|nr:EVE domain-containing protein [Rickettsiales endosymbiont of Stachyamoeba lipophora]
MPNFYWSYTIEIAKYNPRFWVGVASKGHVENGVNLGICQFCHGKSGPAKRLTKGDYVIYYSSKITMEGSNTYKKFTAIGIVKDDETYQVEMFPGFKPFRRNIEYFQDAKHVDIIPFIPKLNFIKNKQSWGYVFRFGFLEIDQESFEIIAKEMLGYVPNK